VLVPDKSFFFYSISSGPVSLLLITPRFDSALELHICCWR